MFPLAMYSESTPEIHTSCGENGSLVNTSLQLQTPNPVNQHYTVNVSIPEGQANLRIPSILESSLHTDDPTSLTFNITSKYTIIDLHIDRGMEGIAISLTECERVWLLWPRDGGGTVGTSSRLLR